MKQAIARGSSYEDILSYSGDDLYNVLLEFNSIDYNFYDPDEYDY